MMMCNGAPGRRCLENECCSLVFFLPPLTYNFATFADIFHHCFPCESKYMYAWRAQHLVHGSLGI